MTTYHQLESKTIMPKIVFFNKHKRTRITSTETYVAWTLLSWSCMVLHACPTHDFKHVSCVF